MTESKSYGWAKKFQAQRSDVSKKRDAKRKAVRTFGKNLNTQEYGKWKKSPGRYDIEGIDTPRPSIEELGLKPFKGESEVRFRKRHTTNFEVVKDGDGEYPDVHLAEPIMGKPRGKCPYCGKISWGKVSVVLDGRYRSLGRLWIMRKLYDVPGVRQDALGGRLGRLGRWPGA